MTEQLYKPGDLVQISHSDVSPMFNGESVLITKAEELNGAWIYEFVIPESRGSVPQHLISRKIAGNMKIPVWHETVWVQP